VEVTEAARVHVVVAVQAPRGNPVLLAAPDGPVGQESLLVLPLPAGVVDVAEMNDMLLSTAPAVAEEYLADGCPHLLGPRNAGGPVRQEYDTGMIADADRICRPAVEGP